jgi:hypothetical protein
MSDIDMDSFTDNNNNNTGDQKHHDLDTIKQNINSLADEAVISGEITCIDEPVKFKIDFVKVQILFTINNVFTNIRSKLDDIKVIIEEKKKSGLSLISDSNQKNDENDNKNDSVKSIVKLDDLLSNETIRKLRINILSKIDEFILTENIQKLKMNAKSKIDDLQQIHEHIQGFKLNAKNKLEEILSNDNIQKLKENATRISIDVQSMHVDCLPHTEIPDLFCEPYIHTGFRPLNQPYTYYVKSLFSKHNETINSWSHYIGALYFLYVALFYDFSDPYVHFKIGRFIFISIQIILFI